jgi:hypothetical protein
MGVPPPSGPASFEARNILVEGKENAIGKLGGTIASKRLQTNTTHSRTVAVRLHRHTTCDVKKQRASISFLFRLLRPGPVRVSVSAPTFREGVAGSYV